MSFPPSQRQPCGRSSTTRRSNAWPRPTSIQSPVPPNSRTIRTAKPITLLAVDSAQSVKIFTAANRKMLLPVVHLARGLISSGQLRGAATTAPSAKTSMVTGVVSVLSRTIPRCFGRPHSRSVAAMHRPLEPCAITHPTVTSKASRLSTLERRVRPVRRPIHFAITVYVLRYSRRVRYFRMVSNCCPEEDLIKPSRFATVRPSEPPQRTRSGLLLGPEANGRA